MKPRFFSPINCLFFAAICILVYACKPGAGIFGKKTPHEQYGDKLSGAGLQQTALGRAWFDAASRSLDNPIGITIPYKETGYFAAERPQATGLRFQARRGEKITIALNKRPANGFAVYLELWRASATAGEKPRLIAAADSTRDAIEHEVDDQATYIVRVQPELLKSGEYTISISAGPSLAYPLKAPGRNHIQSFWGAPRDGGARSHEGIDMFAPRLTPVVAAANGRVTRVNENNLGGKVVWMRPDKKDYVLYYAHLDQQLVTDGQEVSIGDTLGLVGNTGNAKNTAPHLHFGIYASGGAVDPFPFVNPQERVPGNITAPLSSIGKLMRASGRQVKLYSELNDESTTLDQHTLLEVAAAATADWYKVMLPDGRQGLVKSNHADAATELRKLSLKTSQPVYDAPDSLAARKVILKAGDVVSILAAFNDYYYVRTQADITGWINK
jgi:peptidoglycan LD-endopeptidase LytH